MSKERLSKLQKTILNIYFTEEKAQSEIGYDTLMAATAKALGIMAWIGAGKWQIGSDSFKASFSRSIRNLEKKGLVKLNREFLKEYYKNGELKQYWYYYGRSCRYRG